MDGDTMTIGYWITEKKRQKFNWNEFESVCANEGFILKQVNLNMNLDTQGPFHVFLHKFTDTLAHAASGDQNAKAIVGRVQGYIKRHPSMIVIDPLENIRILNDRQQSYRLLHEGLQMTDVFAPNSIELNSTNVAENLSYLQRGGIKFPFVCKPLHAHGSSDAHKMMVIFNKNGLKDCRPPCVAQDFVNHNAILYKLFVVGNHFRVIERPSLKNFYPKDCESLETLFFSSHDISKSGSNSQWSIISKEDEKLSIKPNSHIFEQIIAKVTSIFGLILVGIDVVIENHSGKYAIIDVNVFPGYDGYPNFFVHLIETIKLLINERKNSRLHYNHSTMLKKCSSEELDSGFESDEKKKLSMT